MKMQRQMEYAHQVGSMFIWSPRKDLNSMFIGMVRNEPPLMWAVKLSARRRRGKIIQSE